MLSKPWLIKPYRVLGRLVKNTPLDRMAFVQQACSMIARRVVPPPIEVAGLRYLLDATDAMHLSTQRRIPFLLQHLQEHTREGDIVRDIGAHIGTLALPSRAFTRPGSVPIPDPATCAFDTTIDGADAGHGHRLHGRLCSTVTIAG